jgi:hypothetical protein
LALALLRKRFLDQRELWRLLEQKAMEWLSVVAKGIDWSSVIDGVVLLLEK